MLQGPVWAQMPSGEPVKLKMNALFIVDSSNSMWGKIDGQPKYISSQAVLSGVLKNLPPDASLGLMAYGHRRKMDCSDIEMLAPIGSSSPAQIQKMVANLQPKGTTPLSEALAGAADAFKDTKGAKMVVLITDGGEECGGDPCEVARQLAQTGLVERVNVVGLSLSLQESDQLQCIAKEGGGRYFDVKTPAMLQEAIVELNKEVDTYIAPEQPKIVLKQRAPAVTNPVPLPDDPADLEEHNLLLTSRGGTIVRSEDYSRWKNSILGVDGSYSWVSMGDDVIFSFKNGRTASFSRFGLLLPDTLPQSVQKFELQIADNFEGPYTSIGVFTTKNILSQKVGDVMWESLYQEYSFDEVTAKYVKFVLVSNYGNTIPQVNKGDTQIYQMRLMGQLK
jgi:hypothetical protein